MEQNHGTDRVRFELKERIPLEELVSNISVIRNVEVKPEIEMIAEYSSYRIRGSLFFTGEYEVRKTGETNHPLILDRSANYNKKVVRQIHHYIPVDISLPAERIDEDGVVMEITSLDYDLVEPNQLLVTTEIELQGVRQEETVSVQEQTLEDEVVKNIYVDEANEFVSRTRGWDEVVDPVNHTVSDHHEKEESDQELSELRVEEGVKERTEVMQLDHNEERHELDVRVEVEQTEERIEHEQREADVVQLHIEVENDNEERYVEEEIQGQEEHADRVVEEPEVRVTISNKVSGIMEDSFTEPTDGQRNEEDAPTKAVSILSNILKNREDTMTQIQICLVQPGETIQDIAYRYNIDEGEILRANNISVTSSISGKVLKIPVRKAR